MKQLALCVLVLTTACGAMAAEKGDDTLSESVRQYNESLRWSRFEVAAAFIPPKERPQWVDDWDARAKDLKITDYEVVKVEKGKKDAHVQVKMEWYKDSEGTVHETHARQTWEHRGKAWLKVDEERVRGTEMPGLAEPPPPVDKD